MSRARRLFRAYRARTGLGGMRAWAASEAGDWPHWSPEWEACTEWCRRKRILPLPF